MKLIAHRGLVDGPDSYLENQPAQISRALAMGFDCEIDIWRQHDQLYLGHDAPVYPVPDSYVFNNRFWVHAKNLEALYWLSGQAGVNYFWHERDQYASTAAGYIWTLSTVQATDRTVIMVVDKPASDLLSLPCYAICSDYCKFLSNQVE